LNDAFAAMVAAARILLRGLDDWAAYQSDLYVAPAGIQQTPLEQLHHISQQ
jgi:hypothetical protein